MTASLQNNGVTPPAPLGIDKIPDAQTVLDITAATVVKASPGRLALISVIVAGSAVGAAYDAVSVTGNTAADQVAVIPNTVGVYVIDWPCLAGIVVAPGTGQTISVAYY
jgi:hypothetical protein